MAKRHGLQPSVDDYPPLGRANLLPYTIKRLGDLLENHLAKDIRMGTKPSGSCYRLGYRA